MSAASIRLAKSDKDKDKRAALVAAPRRALVRDGNVLVGCEPHGGAGGNRDARA